MAPTTTAPRPRTAPLAPSPAWQLYRLSIDQYHRMAELGILTTSDRVELLEGLLVCKMTHNPPHDVTLALVDGALRRLLPEEWGVRVQSAITLRNSEPEPDVAVVRGPHRRYAQSHPGPADIALLVEVADSSLAEDREDNARRYALARIPVYWIVNIPGEVVEVSTDPVAGRAPRYRQNRTYARGEEVPVVIAGQEVARIPVRDLLV